MIGQHARDLIAAIESGAPEWRIGELTDALVKAHGGLADVRSMTPGAAALYLNALLTRRLYGNES